MNKQRHIFTWFIATWFGSGLLPVAPGTWGSLVAIPFAYVISIFNGPYAFVSGIVALFFVGTWVSDKVENNSEKKDPGFIVVDEVVGQWIALIPLPFLYTIVDPASSHFLSVTLAAVAFLTFRIFDIWKPWPIRQIEEKTHGGYGIMLDDVIAGMYALIITSALVVGVATVFIQ